MLKVAHSLVLLTLAYPLCAQRYGFQYYGREQGLLNVTPQCLLQDRTGYLWAGTQNGLFRYNGARFTQFNVGDGLPSMFINAVHETRDGVLWVGTSGGLARRIESKGKVRFERVVMITAAPEDVRQNSIASDSNGRLFVGTGSGLAVGTPHGASFAFLLYPASRSIPAVAGVYVDNSDRVWYWCGSRVCRFVDGKAVPAGQDLDASPNISASLLMDRDGNLWARSSDSMFVLRKGAARFVRDDRDLPSSNSYSSVYLDRENTLLVPTDLGLARRNKDRWELIGKNQGLVTSATSTVLQDREGSIWIGCAGSGLARWKGYRQWESWTDRDGLGNDNIWAITRDTAGQLWAGNDIGLFRERTSGNGDSAAWEEFKLGRQHRTLDSIAGDSDGTLWVGSSSGLLARVTPSSRTVRVYSAADGLENQDVFQVLIDSSRTLWVSTRGGLFKADLTVRPFHFSQIDLPDTGEAPGVRLLLDHKKQLWVGGRGFLLRLSKSGEWHKFTTRDGVKPIPIRRLAETPDGVIWVGYFGTSIARLMTTGDRLVVEDLSVRATGRPPLNTALGTDSQGRLWLTTDDGVDFLDGTSWRHYGSPEGLISDDCNGNAFFGDADGSVWIGTSSGLSHFRLPAVEVSQVPQVIIDGYRLGSREHAPGETAVAPADARVFTVSFNALTFLNPSAVLFRYRLKGLDENWAEGPQREIQYPGLPGGGYTFEVTAKGPSGAWTPSVARVSFSVEPPWWQSWLFRIACAVALLSFGGSFWMWRIRTILRVQRGLEMAVQERTEQFLRERQRVVEEKKTVEAKNQEIERLLHESQRAVQFKSQFLANMSHEIRTPMNGIIGLTELTLDTKLSAEQRTNLDMVCSSAKSLLSVINDVLDFSKVEAGKLDLEEIEFNLREHLNGIIGMLNYRAREKSLLLTCRIDSSVPDRLVGDPGRVRQILINLLGNAIKFTQRGEVSLYVSEPRFANQPQSGQLALLHFEVRDSGIGIPKEQLTLILQPFRQGDESINRKYGGTGLGLAISLQLVELMNGRLWVESEIGKGSKFHFTARFGRAAAQKSLPAPQLAMVPAPPLRSMRMLVAEDNKINQKLMTTLLERKGHLVTMAETGKEAVDLVEHHQFDLLLMDMQMPEMDGLEAARLIRESEQGTGRHLHIIAITASAMVGDKERCLAAGMDEYISKPIDANHLYSVIESLANARPPAASTAAAAAVPGVAAS